MSENKKKLCSKENPCRECKDKQKELLNKIEDWEVKRKEKIEKFETMEFEYCNNRRSDGNKFQYSSFGYSQGYSYEPCPDCGKENSLWFICKSNEYGDKMKSLTKKECNCDIQSDNQIKSNQIKSNQIKSNQIKSNQIKSNQTQDLGSKNYLPYILGGGFLVLGIGGLVWYFAKNNNKEIKE